MAECDTAIRTSRLPDIGAAFDAMVSRVITAQAAVASSPDDLVKRVYEELGRARNPITTTSGAEQWVAQLPAAQRVRPTKAQSKYKFATYNAWATGNLPLTHSIRLWGVLIGADKLGHFFQQGYEYFQRVEQTGNLADAIQYGWGLENTQYGLSSSGVFSNADMRANLQGYHFYEWLRRTNGGGTFTLRRWLDPTWNEEYNTNAYKGDVVVPVWRALLHGSWSGFFTRDVAPREGRIPIRVQWTTLQHGLSLSTSTISGSFNYTDPQNRARSGLLSGNIQYKPFTGNPRHGYRGVRIDYSWRRGPYTGTGVFDSGLRENDIRGTWGSAHNHHDGGTFYLRKV